MSAQELEDVLREYHDRLVAEIGWPYPVSPWPPSSAVEALVSSFGRSLAPPESVVWYRWLDSLGLDETAQVDVFPACGVNAPKVMLRLQQQTEETHQRDNTDLDYRLPTSGWDWIPLWHSVNGAAVALLKHQEPRLSQTAMLGADASVCRRKCDTWCLHEKPGGFAFGPFVAQSATGQKPSLQSDHEQLPKVTLLDVVQAAIEAITDNSFMMDSSRGTPRLTHVGFTGENRDYRTLAYPWWPQLLPPDPDFNPRSD